MARNYSSIAEIKTLAADVPMSGFNSDKVTVQPNINGFPTVPFVLVLNPDTTNEEVVLATSLSGSTYTVTRNIEGGGIKSHTINQTVKHMIVGSDLQIVHDHFSATTGVHGLNIGASPAPTASPTFTGNVVLPSTTSIGTVSSTEIGYLDGVTSSLQTQIGTVNTALTTNTPVGSIVMWAKNEIPTGWLECNGQSTASYTALAAVVGANVPDMQGLVPVGFKSGDADFGVLKGTGGNKATQAHAHSASDVGAHAHGGGHIGGNSYRIYGATYGGDGYHAHDIASVWTSDNNHDHAGRPGSWEERASGAPDRSGDLEILSGAALGGGSHQHSTYVDFNGDGGHGHTIGSFGTGVVSTAVNGNLQPYFTLKFIIKF
jgi:microcystin-dependent protein